MTLICSIYNRTELFPHFINYYTGMGITQFIFGVWNGKNNSSWDYLSTFGTNVILEEGTSDIRTSINDATLQNQLRQKYVDKGEWFSIADLDEFHALHPYTRFSDIAKDAQKQNAEIVMSEFVDRIALNGVLPETITTASLWEQFPVSAPVTRDIVHGVCQKVMLMRGDIEICCGHHPFDETRRKFSKVGQTYHFKWWGNLLEQSTARWHQYEAMNIPWYNESQVLAEHLQRNHCIAVKSSTSSLLYFSPPSSQ
jgi:hypothetical protein